MELVDTHCHIQSAGRAGGERSTAEAWAKDASLTGDTLIVRAKEQGVSKLICVGCDLKDSKLAIDFAGSREGCYASIGIHPHEAKGYVSDSSKLAELTSLASSLKVVAVGECGLDYFYTHSPKEDQTAILKFQIELALAKSLPLIFHVREAYDDFWPVFDSYQGIRGVLHSFTDSAANLDKALQRGLYIGVNGIATFARDPAQREVYKQIPLSSLLLETDAPFLTPTPYRGSINEPKHVLAVAKFLASSRSESLETIASESTTNANTLFWTY